MLLRRTMMGALSFGMLGVAVRPGLAAIATPAQTEGPFYPRSSDLGPDRDNDLVRITGAVKQAGGEILIFAGDVRDIHGKTLSGALVEIWQCDVNGRYLHGRDFSATRIRDRYFQGYGQTRTDARGRFVFRTIKPVPYPGRTPHIHVKIHDPGGDFVLTTQIYIDGVAQNRRDGLYQRLSQEQRKAVTMALKRRETGEWMGAVRLVL